MRDCVEFESILNKYEQAKLNTYKVLELLGSDYVFNYYGADTHDKHYQTLLDCGTLLVFHKEETESRNIYHLTHSNFCRQRVCPMCQFRKSEKAFAEMLKIVEKLEGDGYRFLHLVLTVPNCDDGAELVNSIKQMYKGFGYLYNDKRTKKAFKGCLRCLEVSYNYNNDTFHPHLHCLIAVKKSYFNDTKVYLSQQKIQELWTKSIERTGLIKDIACPLQVYIKAVKEGDRKGVAEVTKYCLKPLDFSKSDNAMANTRVLLTLWHTLKGMRFVQKYGIIKEKYQELGCSDEDLTDSINIANMKKTVVEWDSSILKYR